ncbi:polyphosphate glucokinase [bacterium SCGC AG-212-C10]|nr:polyphosphate glucokinase [bacterium SCGC AG-212-C10]
MSTKALGIDIGGTGIKLATVELERGKLASERKRARTPQPATPKLMGAALAKLLDDPDVAGATIVGAGFPAVIKDGTALTAANVSKEWIGTDVAALIGGLVQQRVSVLNDADAAGLAEVRFGAGKGQMGEIIMVTLGTGIGTGMFVDGKLVPSSELGHMEIRGKEAESRASASARERRKISWKEWAMDVQEFLRTLDRLFWPELIIIGGGVSANPERFMPHISVRCRLEVATMGNSAGIVGAALYASEQP